MSLVAFGWASWTFLSWGRSRRWCWWSCWPRRTRCSSWCGRMAGSSWRHRLEHRCGWRRILRLRRRIRIATRLGLSRVRLELIRIPSPLASIAWGPIAVPWSRGLVLWPRIYQRLERFDLFQDTHLRLRELLTFLLERLYELLHPRGRRNL